MMDIDSMIAVLQAAKAGKKIQINVSGKWTDLDANPSFGAPINSYRVKPEPREWWIVQSKIEENFNIHAFRDFRDAENYNLGYWGKTPIKVREVLE
jgi:hypothetical protein